jgi:hypothetical protein
MIMRITVWLALIPGLLFLAAAIRHDHPFYLIPAASFLVAAGAMWLRNGGRRVDEITNEALEPRKGDPGE